MNQRNFLVLIVAVMLFGTGCKSPCNGPSGRSTGWCVEGETVPQAYLDEIAIALSVIGVKWTGHIQITDQPFKCNEVWACGCTWDMGAIEVLYNPAYGYGPDVGTTALEHEICHAVGYWDDASAKACVAAALPIIKSKLGVPQPPAVE